MIRYIQSEEGELCELMFTGTPLPTVYTGSCSIWKITGDFRMEGHTVSYYRILEKIGQGGMGEVHSANDTTLGQDSVGK